jgi:hypothetical protein
MPPSGQLPGVWILYADVTKHCRFHLHRQVDEEGLNLRILWVFIREKVGSKIGWANSKEGDGVGVGPVTEQVVMGVTTHIETADARGGLYVYYPDVCLQLNTFRAFSRPSSGAQWLQPLVLPATSVIVLLMMGGKTSETLRIAEDFFARKIRQLRPGLNPRSWVPEANMLTTRPP